MDYTPQIVYVYDDKTENLLDQYTQQLAHCEKVFAARNKHLKIQDYARLRDTDLVMMAILDVIAKIYEQAIPVAIQVFEEVGKNPNDTTH